MQERSCAREDSLFWTLSHTASPTESCDLSHPISSTWPLSHMASLAKLTPPTRSVKSIDRSASLAKLASLVSWFNHYIAVLIQAFDGLSFFLL